MKKVIFIFVALMACTSVFAQLPDVKKSTWYANILTLLDAQEDIPGVNDTVLLTGIDGTLWIVGEKHSLYRLSDGYEYPGGYVSKDDLTIVGKNHDLYKWVEDWANAVNKIQSKYKLIMVDEWIINRYGGVQPDIFFINNYNKTIKYITVNYKVYNPVNDPCKFSNNSYTSYVKCVGPIEPGGSASYKFDSPTAYTSYDASNVKITSIVIQFMNNTKITLTKQSQYKVEESDNLEYYMYLKYRQGIF